MDVTYIYEGTVTVDSENGKVFLVSTKAHTVIDLNRHMLKFTGEKVKIVVAKAEDI